jgi:hypothetical protein
MDRQNDAAITAQAQAEIREQDRTLASRLKTARSSEKSSELMQLAAIYAALPEERRQHWFERLSVFGLAAELLERIVERANRLIQSPDWNTDRFSALRRKTRSAMARAGNRRSTDP